MVAVIGPSDLRVPDTRRDVDRVPAEAVFGERIWAEVHPPLGVLGNSTGLIFTKTRDMVMGISDQYPIQSRRQTATASSGSTANRVLDRRMRQRGGYRWVQRQPGRLGRGRARVPDRRSTRPLAN
jgi:hypothetical protein